MTRSERIHPLSQRLADQIAAGEVVERPASVVKELVENSVDAGARKIEVSLEAAGMTRIHVIDDGRGMHPDDLALALQRHATSKIRVQEDLTEIGTLGFRGEALASIAAVARVTIRSRPSGASVGTQLISRPGAPPERAEVGMPLGTQIEVAGLFASVPARRKFIRAEATEIGHCMDCVQQVAAVEPAVGFRLSHGGRKLLSFPASDEPGRVAQLLDRRGRGPYEAFDETVEGIRVRGWLAHPDHAGRQRRGPLLIVRRRVIRDRNLSQIVRGAYEPLLGPRLSPVACIFIEPPRGEVDVNVHPQKSEVRFAAPQAVYAAVRSAMNAAIDAAGWRDAGPHDETGEAPGTDTQRSIQSAAAAWGASAGRSTAAEGLGPRGRAPAGGRTGDSAGAGRPVYRLTTARGGTPGRVAATPGHTRGLAADLALDAHTGTRTLDSGTSPARSEADAPTLLTVLPGLVALFEHGAEMIALDLRRVRVHLVEAQLLRELGGGAVASQRLLQPVVISRPAPQLQALLSAAPELLTLGVELEAFGDGALVVRGVPASLDGLEDSAGVEALIDKVLAWAQLVGQGTAAPAQQAEDDPMRGGVRALSESGEVPTGAAARLAKQWVRTLWRDRRERPLHEIPGVRVWSAASLVTRPVSKQAGG